MAAADERQRQRLMLASNTCLLTGPVPSSGLWWAYCHSVAAEGDTAFVVCERRRLERGGAGPSLTPGCAPKAPAWQRVALRYVDSAQEAARVLLSVHELAPPPRVLVLDVDWAALLPPGRGAEAARLAGLLLSALLGAGRQMACIVACDAESEPLLRRYVPHVLQLSSAGSLHVLQVEQSPAHAKVRFTISNANLLQLHSVI